MPVTIAKSQGVTVLTLTSDPQSSCPPLCQILKGLCCSPVCCSVSQHLRRVQKTSQSLLGALHIVIGMLNIGLGAIPFNGSELSPFWLGGMFILFGIVSILSEKYPSPCLVFLNVFLNLAGVGFAIAAIIIYSLNIEFMNLWWMCDDDDYLSPYNTRSPQEDVWMEKCLEGKAIILMLKRGIIAILIILSILELCVVISSAVLGIKALRSSEKEENKSTDDPEQYKKLLEKVTTSPTV
ncbi:membrane-spanning 4-domains subfamily A member 6C-like isoform X2 [Chaetodon trifascialis]